MKFNSLTTGGYEGSFSVPTASLYSTTIIDRLQAARDRGSNFSMETAGKAWEKPRDNIIKSPERLMRVKQPKAFGDGHLTQRLK